MVKDANCFLVEIYMFSRRKFILTVKTLVCWVTTCSVDGTHILKMESIISFYKDTKYPLEISLMGTGYSGRPFQ